MSSVEITVIGDKAAVARLERTASGVLNLRKPMTDIGDYLTSFFSGEVFASRGGVIGEPWPPLNPRYAARKAQEWPGRPPLVKTGRMMRSFISRPGLTSVSISNTAPYFDFHQSAASRHRLPRRVMMGVDQTRARRIGEIVASYINRRLEQNA